MLKRFSGAFSGLALLLVLLSVHAAVCAQAATSSQPMTVAGTTQAILSSLSTLPEADTLFFINPQRILNDAAPKLMSEADVVRMREQFTQLKQMAGVDPSRLDYLVVAVRFRKPGSDLAFSAPEFLAVTSGDFSSDSLMTLAGLQLQDRLTQEKYGSKTIGLMTIDELAKEAGKNPFLKSFSQIAVTALNSNTIALGSVSYVKAAVDAAEGRERISAQTLNSLLREPNALLSSAGSPWTSFAKSFGLMGTESNPRVPRCDSHLGDFYAAVTMEGNVFKLRGAMNADNPDTAKIINNMLSGLMKTFPADGKDAKAFPSLLNMISLSAVDNEVLLQADFPQQILMDMLRERMKPAPAATTETKTTAPNPVKKRRPVRRRRSAT